MTPEPETREYLAAIKRLKERRKEFWKMKLSEIPKPAVKIHQKPDSLDLPPQRRYAKYKESPMGRAD
jgi:hypothetical protein